tara:strand:- start:136 stop:609 length:474 start_codon:yes stop_codon:yes gene_type:complete
MSKKPKTIKLPESKKEFISLGKYLDNNDGIDIYYPNSHNFDNWKSFFLEESPIIQIFALEHFSGMEISTLSLYGKSITDIITKNKSLISNFFRKNYDWPYDDRFEDSIWFHGSDVRAKLRLTVRKLLIKYGYPPDLARMEADRVIEQSELLAESFTN